MKNDQIHTRSYFVKKASAVIIALFMLLTTCSALMQVPTHQTVRASEDDTTPPIQTIEFGDPKQTVTWRSNTYNLIAEGTPIWINSTDDQSGSERIEYSIWLAVDLNANPIQWRHLPQYDTVVYSQGDDLSISAELYLHETCFHEIRYQCWDKAGNTAGLYTKDVFVDATAPVTTKTVGCPQYEQGIIQPSWASGRTPITFTSVDESCLPEWSGVNNLVIEVWWKENSCSDEGAFTQVDTITIVDQDANDLDTTPGIISYVYYFANSGFYELEWYGNDVLGNTEIAWKQQHRVDVEPPAITKIHPEHGYMRINDHEGYLKCGLPISLTAIDEPSGTCNVGVDRLFWRYEYNGQTYPIAGEDGAINGEDIAEQYCFNDPTIENYWWYPYTTDIVFNEECQHDLYYFATDNIGNYEVHHQIYYVDNTEPYVEVSYPIHGYYSNDVDYLKSNTAITLNAYDNPDNLCKSGIESLFYRYEWDGTSYPTTPVDNIVSGQDLVGLYGEDYNISDITDYYWYRIDEPSADIQFPEQCQHDLYFFAKDNVCHRSEIYHLTFYVDSEAPYAEITYPDHGYYENEGHFLKANTSFTINTYDQPENSPCAAGIESLFWRYEWNQTSYPEGPGDGIVSGNDLVTMYGEDYNIPAITDYYWYYLDEPTVDIKFMEECEHTLFYFTKDNVCHRSIIYEEDIHVDNSSPVVDYRFPDEHGYYDHHIRSNLPFYLDAYDLPNNECAAGIEGFFYRWEHNGIFYPTELGDGIIDGHDLVTMYGEDYNITEITDYLWYMVADDLVQLSFAESCTYDIYAFAKDNVCHRSDIYHHTIYVDDEAPTVSLDLPTHGYVRIDDTSGYWNSDKTMTIRGTDFPEGDCGSGIESIFYRYEWNNEFYPSGEGNGIIEGTMLAQLYGEDYNIPDITEYWWYYVDSASAPVQLTEQCIHDLYFFTKDNVCHRSDILTHRFYVDDENPSITYTIPQEHGYYIDTQQHTHIKPDQPVTFTASDYPENDCGAGIESIFYRYEWNNEFYPSGEGNGIIEGTMLAQLYGEDYNIQDITDYYWYRVDDSTMTISFSNECEHTIYYFTKDTVCHRSDIAQTTWYIDSTGPIVTPTYPTHGYIPQSDTSGYLKVGTPFTLTAQDLPESDCAAGVEALFFRYEWENTMYPGETGDNVVSGQDLVDMYGEDYNTSDIQPYLWYRIDGTTTEIEFADQCQHDLYYFAKDNLCNHGVVTTHTYYVDATVPMVDVEVAEEGSIVLNEKDYLQCGVPIWINATDTGECQAGVESIFYRYLWNDTMYPEGPGQGIVSGQELVAMYGESYTIDSIVSYYWYRVDADTATVLFDENCEHVLYYFAKDNVCQHSDVYSHDFYVDCTPPTIIKEVGEPQHVVTEGEEYCITTRTPIYIDAYDTGCCDNLPITVEYKINDGDWITITGPTTLYMNEECDHTLTIRAIDCVGNIASDIELFHVDDTPPVIIKTVGDPKIVVEEDIEYCISPLTEITVEAQDQGCCNCGEITIEYRVWYNGEWTKWAPYVGPITFPEDCTHYLEIKATDCLGNFAIDNETFRVDSTPPVLTKIVGYPHVDLGVDEFGHDQWMVFPETFITFTAEDFGCCPCPDPMIYYRYWFLGQWTDWMIYNQPFNFNRGCLHYLEAYTVDCLGNAGPVDNETFIVHVPDGYDDPLINFENPLNGETYCERTLDVIINASDAQTPTQDLTVVLWIPEGRRGAPRLLYETTYNPVDGFFHASIDIFEYQNGAEITLEAYVIDSDNNYVFAIPVTFTVCSNTGYDQWMQDGWNSLTIPWGEISCSNLVEDVLGSIHGNYDLVFVYDTLTNDWTSYSQWRTDNGYPNDLETMDPGVQYWIYMNTADRYYTDTTPPVVTIESPLNDTILNVLPEITGIAYDGETGLKNVVVTIHDTNDNKYWDGDSWEDLETELLCTGLENWMYNSTTVTWTSGHTYHVTAIATDMVGCQDIDMIMFVWDANPPIITILDPINGEERTSGPGEIKAEVYDEVCYVTEVYVEIFDQTSSLYFNGTLWQADQIWLSATYDVDNLYFYPTEGIWPAEFGHVFQITVKASDCIDNTGMLTHSFTIIEPQGECSPDYTYTTDADFDKGILSSVEHETVHDQLQMILGEVTTFPTMWIANAGEDSISKWDTQTNKELARYHTWFGPLAAHGAWEGAAPSRTCVDAEGNCYVANRHFDGLPADVIKIYTTDWIDRNGNGILDTSWDINGDGTITADEMLPMVDTNGNQKIDDNEITDERVAWAVSVGGYNGLGRSLAIDLEGNIWVGLYNNYQYYKLSSVDGSILGGPYYVGSAPYGALVDRYGYLWGSTLGGTLLKFNTRDPTDYQNFYVPNTYGIALGYDTLGNTLVYLGGNYPYVIFNSSSQTYTNAPNSLFYDLGVATDSKGNIVAGSTSDGSVAKFAPNGDVIWYVAGQVYSEVRGMAVDSDDNVWAIHRDMSKLCKYNGTDGSPLGVFNAGYQPYTYSDATGLGYMTSISVGSWDVIHDSYAADTIWNRISWTSDEPEGSQITVKVRSSNDKITWSPWEIATNGNTLSTTSTGRYLNILTTFEQDPLGQSPILYDLTVDGTCAGVVETPHVSMQKQVWVPPPENVQNGGGEIIPLDASPTEFVTYTYTLADIVIFGYEDNTTVTIYDYTGNSVWTGTVDDGTYHQEYVADGVYKLVGNKKYAVLTGDPITDYVMGFYGMDQNGYGASTKLYTYMPKTYCTDYFIVFAYTNDTQVTITNLNTDTVVWSGTLNRGQHYTDETLDENFVKVEANYPVSALSYNDQGFFVPSANQKWSGNEFYTFSDNICYWQNTLHVMAFEDGTTVTIKDSDSDAMYWTGMLNAGEEKEITTTESIYYSIFSDKVVTVAVLPVDGFQDGYYYGNYMMDKLGSGVGTEFYIPTLPDGYGEVTMIWAFAFENDTTINVYDPSTDQLMNTYYLNQGEAKNIAQGYGYWYIVSDKRISGYAGWGSAAQAAFAPLLFGEAASAGYWGEERDANVGDTVRFKISIDNDGQCDFLSGSLTDYLPNGLQYVEGSTNITMLYNGETWYANDSNKEPWIISGPEETILLWNGSSGIGQGYPPTMEAYFEFEALVVDCSEPVVVNTANITVEPACGDVLYAQDTASVNMQCVECNPTGTVEKAVWDSEMKEWVPSLDTGLGDEVSFGIHAIIPEGACTLYNGYMEDYLPDGLNYIPESTNIILYYGGNLYQNLTGSVVEPYITDHEGYVTLRWDSQNGYAETLPATGEVYISYRAVVTDTGTFVNIANGTGYTISDVVVNDDGNATVYVPSQENQPPVVAITSPVDEEILQEYPFTISGYAYDADPGDFVGEVSMQYYLDMDGTKLYYNGTSESWSLEPFTFVFSGSGSGTQADPLTWTLNDFPITESYGPYYVYAYAYDQHNRMGEDTISFWYLEQQNVRPVVDITHPENGDIFNYGQDGELSITGTAYDIDTYVDEVHIALYYLDDVTPYYYGHDDINGWGWYQDEFYLPASAVSGAGTMGDPLYWETIPEPVFPVDYEKYYVYAEVYDHDTPTPQTGSDTTWFWYPDAPNPLSINKTVWDPDSSTWVDFLQVYLGQTVKYSIVIENMGDHDLSEIVVDDYLPDDAHYYTGGQIVEVNAVPYSITPVEWGNNLTWDFTGLILAPGDVITIFFDAYVYQDHHDGEINQAEVSAYCANLALDLYNQDTAMVYGFYGLDNQPPLAKFFYDPHPPVAGEPVSFTDASMDTDGYIVDWSWDFGDGLGTSEEQNPTYTYANPGQYTVTLTVTDEDGSMDSMMRVLMINNPQYYTLSGRIFYDGAENGILIIALFNENPEDIGVTPMDSIHIPESYDFPVDYTFNNLIDGTYYVAAHIDMNDNDGPPDAGEPAGWAINNTMWLESPDPLSIVDADFTDADVTLSVTSSNNPPNTPANPFPMDTAIDVPYDLLEMSWDGGDNDLTDTVTYDIYFGTDPDPSYITYRGPYPADEITQTFQISTLIPNTIYYWKIIAEDNNGASTEGPIWSFTTLASTNNPPFEPYDPDPSDGEIDVPLGDESILWHGGDPDVGDQVTYDVYLGTDPVPAYRTSIGPWDYDLNPYGINFGIPMTPETTYYWKIIAEDNHGAITEGPIWSFTTEEEPPNSAPFIPSTPIPFNGSTISMPTDGFLTINWSGGDADSNDMIWYKVYFGTNPVPSNLIGTSGYWWGSDIAQYYEYIEVSPGTTYYWKIIANDSHNAITEGPIWSFTTGFNGLNPLDFVGYWKFDEGTGTTASDSSGQDRPGTLFGSPNWVTGKVGNALEFDSTGDFVKLLYSDGVLVSGDFTLMAWVKAPASASICNIITRTDESIWTTGGLRLFTRLDNKAWLGLYGDNTIASSGSVVRDDTWHFVVGVRDSMENLMVYVDGVQNGNLGYNTSDSTTLNWFIGSTWGGNDPFDGIIDEVAILDRDLSASEITLCYNNGLAGHGYIS